MEIFYILNSVSKNQSLVHLHTPPLSFWVNNRHQVVGSVQIVDIFYFFFHASRESSTP